MCTFAPITPQHAQGSGSGPVNILEQVLSKKHKGPSIKEAPGANGLDGSDNFMVYPWLCCCLCELNQRVGITLNIITLYTHVIHFSEIVRWKFRS